MSFEQNLRFALAIGQGIIKKIYSETDINIQGCHQRTLACQTNSPDTQSPANNFLTMLVREGKWSTRILGGGSCLHVNSKVGSLDGSQYLGKQTSGSRSSKSIQTASTPGSWTSWFNNQMWQYKCLSQPYIKGYMALCKGGLWRQEGCLTSPTEEK